LFCIMYAVTGELPAAHGWRPTETVMALRPCARTIDGTESATDAAPAVVMNLRRDTPRIGSFVVMRSSSCGVDQATAAR
jgi:hypothetical protein